MKKTFEQKYIELGYVYKVRYMEFEDGETKSSFIGANNFQDACEIANDIYDREDECAVIDVQVVLSSANIIIRRE